MSDSEHDHEEPPALASQVAVVKVLCPTTRDELYALNLTLIDVCPVCEIVVGRHHHTHTAAAPSSVPQAGHEAARPLSETRVAEQLAKLASHLDKWSKQSVCRPFLQRIQQVLTVSRI